MYAIIDACGRQYKVREGEVIFIERLPDSEESQVVFENVIALSGEDGAVFGTPYVEGAKVTAKVLKHGKDKKIIVYKYKAKKNYRKKQGHRQPYTKVQIEDISKG